VVETAQYTIIFLKGCGDFGCCRYNKVHYTTCMLFNYGPVTNANRADTSACARTRFAKYDIINVSCSRWHC
jgi:hypothetical protein